MPDTRSHRGPHPHDQTLFAADQNERLVEAVRDLSWLMNRGYSMNSAAKLVGDRFQLVDRQRQAVRRCSAAEAALRKRENNRIEVADLKNQPLAIDTFNLLTTIEAALSAGVLIRGRDGCLRDMASMHGTYRKVAETLPALKLIASRLEFHRVSSVHWLLDRPVSNSGRLAAVIREIANSRDANWTVELDNNPDGSLIADKKSVIVSADSYVIENTQRWFWLCNDVVEQLIPDAWIVDLSR